MFDPAVTGLEVFMVLCLIVTGATLIVFKRTNTDLRNFLHEVRFGKHEPNGNGK